MDLTLYSDRSGLVLEPGAMVVRHGVQIGKVAAVRPEGDGARIELELDRRYEGRLPAETTADITSSTLFGGKRVVLGDGGPAATQVLASGDTLRADSVTTETQTVFQSLSEV